MSAPGVTGGVTMQPYMSAWPRGSHMSSAQVVVVLAHRRTPLEYRRARQRRHARSDDPQRLAAGVGVDRADQA